MVLPHTKTPQIRREKRSVGALALLHVTCASVTLLSSSTSFFEPPCLISRCFSRHPATVWIECHWTNATEPRGRHAHRAELESKVARFELRTWLAELQFCGAEFEHSSSTHAELNSSPRLHDSSFARSWPNLSGVTELGRSSAGLKFTRQEVNSSSHGDSSSCIYEFQLYALISGQLEIHGNMNLSCDQTEILEIQRILVHASANTEIISPPIRVLFDYWKGRQVVKEFGKALAILLWGDVFRDLVNAQKVNPVPPSAAIAATLPPNCRPKNSNCRQVPPHLAAVLVTLSLCHTTAAIAPSPPKLHYNSVEKYRVVRNVWT
ncbi:hypothetical protein K438DRAFT_1770814 [Mycena galopus ATCC 62051]|nr:hypothetical protein K438DRAFT_1770814 [Mycena galopus ATCC 62051]